MSIWVHTLVRNEERYIWFAVMSVIDYVDRVLLWDTGSEDRTIDIIHEIKRLYPSKISFREVKQKDIYKFTYLRQEMLEATKCSWFMIVDGDEVWWDWAIKEVAEIIRKKGSKIESIVNRYYNVVGDIYHYQSEGAGRYEIDGMVGHLTIRATSTRIPGIHFSKPHGVQGIFDDKEVPIQNRSKKKRDYLERPAYMHFTNVQRSSTLHLDSKVPKRKMKLKHKLGNSFPFDFYYPEVFFKPRPNIVSSPWENISNKFKIRAFVETPFRSFKRSFVGKDSSGY